MRTDDLGLACLLLGKKLLVGSLANLESVVISGPLAEIMECALSNP
jgi:hypothetical protein